MIAENLGLPYTITITRLLQVKTGILSVILGMFKVHRNSHPWLASVVSGNT